MDIQSMASELAKHRTQERPEGLAAPTWTPTNHEYHGMRERCSSTMLKTFRESPEMYRRKYLLGEEDRSLPGEGMAIGSALGCLVLEPHRVEAEIEVITKVTTRKNKTMEKLYADSPEKTFLVERELAPLAGMVASLCAAGTPHAMAARVALLQLPGWSEFAITWDDPLGVSCKSKVDRLTVDPETWRIHVWEFKTDRDASPEGFAKQAVNLGYREQAAFNLRGLEDAFGGEARLSWVVAHNEPPYEWVVYPLDPIDREIGQENVERDLRMLSAWLEAGEGEPWRQPWELDDNFPPLQFPRWSRRSVGAAA